MKRSFKTRLEAIDWIAANTENERQFELLREQLNYNYIYFNVYFIDQADLFNDVTLSNDKPSSNK